MTETPDIREVRHRFPATEQVAYFNTAAVGLASRALTDAYHRFIDEWAQHGLDYAHAEAAADQARTLVARLMGASATNVALIPSVSSAAGLVVAQFGPATSGQNIVIGEREYSSNHFPWRQLAHKGYAIRQVPFRNGGLEPEAIAGHVDEHTQPIAFSAVQAASGHGSDIPAIGAMARAEPPRETAISVSLSTSIATKTTLTDSSRRFPRSDFVRSLPPVGSGYGRT